MSMFASASFGPAIGFLTAFCAWSLMSIVWSESPHAAVQHTLVWATYAVILLLSLSAAQKGGGKTLILDTFIAVAILVGVLSCFDFITLQDFSVQEGSLRIRYGKFAELLATIAPVVFSASLKFSGRQRLLLAAIGLLGWTGIMLSLSKGAFLAGGFAFVLLFASAAVFKRRMRKQVLVSAAVWIAFTVSFQLAFSALTAVPSTTDYISGDHDATRSTSSMRIYTWKVAVEMLRSQPVFGVGADNFGISVNDARRALAQKSPGDADSAIGEDYIFERAHNEPLQIASELGIAGFLLFSGFAISILAIIVRAIWTNGTRLSPLCYGGLAGMAGFAIGSMVSSFSFRAFQNGAVFFLVLGLTLALTRRRPSEPSATFKDARLSTIVVTVPILLALFSASKAASQYVHFWGERTADTQTAVRLYETAARLDADNAGPELASAERLAREKRWVDTVPYFRRSIEKGFGVSVIYSYLANAQEQAGDPSASADTLREACEIFPRSVFLRVRWATNLEKLGRNDEAAKEMEIARSIDMRQANGWHSVMKDGILYAHIHATNDPTNFAAPPDLMPENAIHAYNDQKAFFDDPK
jgi:O-antigen ligase